MILTNDQKDTFCALFKQTFDMFYLLFLLFLCLDEDNISAMTFFVYKIRTSGRNTHDFCENIDNYTLYVRFGVRGPRILNTFP